MADEVVDGGLSFVVLTQSLDLFRCTPKPTFLRGGAGVNIGPHHSNEVHYPNFGCLIDTCVVAQRLSVRLTDRLHAYQAHLFQGEYDLGIVRHILKWRKEQYRRIVVSA